MTSQPSGQDPASIPLPTSPPQRPDGKTGSDLPQSRSPTKPSRSSRSSSPTIYGPPIAPPQIGKMDIRYGGIVDMSGPTSRGGEYGARREAGPGGTYEEPPTGWTPNLTWDPQTVVTQVGDAFKQDETLISRNELPPSYIRDHLWGFDPITLAKGRMIDDAEAKPNNLQNPIHPIFRQDRWKSTPLEMYRFMHPALRLASKFLTSASCSQYWITLLLGRREIDVAASVKLGLRKQRIVEDPPLTIEAWRKVQERLEYYANQTECVTFHWQGWHGPQYQRSTSISPLFSDARNFASTKHIRHTEVIQSLLTKDWLNPKVPGEEQWHCKTNALSTLWARS